jgi:hypothetical protein
MTPRRWLLWLVLACGAMDAFAHGDHGAGAEAFRRLASLVGTWEGSTPEGKKHSVAYRLTAGGTTLIETWTLGADRESITMYHLDGDALIATHYCPQGNQPRLQLESSEGADRLSFAFKDGTNLLVPDGWHQHSFWLRFDSPEAFTRSETYVGNGSTPEDIAKAEAGAAVKYQRR